MRRLATALTVAFLCGFLHGAEKPVALGKVRTAEYKELQSHLCRGWNTWYNGSMTAHVKLPERVGFNFGLANAEQSEYRRDFLKYSEKANHPARIVPGLRADDGAYTSATIGMRDFDVRLETATDGEDLLALVTPLDKAEGNLVVIEPLSPYSGDATIGVANARAFSKRGIRFELGTTGRIVPAEYLPMPAPRLAVRIEKDRPLAFFTGRSRTVDEVRAFVAVRRTAAEARAAAHGEKADAFRAMQTVLAWNNIYDAPNQRLIAPVSRVWNISSGGWVLFDWDTYFAAYMCALFNRDLAFAHAVEITKSVTEEGFVPNFRNALGVSADRSQPPVGSKIVLEIYRRHPARWFLEETYDELIAWNRWWPEARDYDGFLCWGTHVWKDGRRLPGTQQDAMFESGLDNSPAFDDVPMSPDRPVMMQADVGLMSMYVMDCKALAKIAAELGRDKDAEELLARGKRYAAKLATLWNEDRGIYMNRRLDTGAFNDVLTPCNFYPLLAGVPTKEQAARMVREHYFNPDEFHGTYVMPASARNARGYADNSYWRGRIWAPLNLLVYLGFRDYRLDEARHDLVIRSNDLLMKNWRTTGGIYENYNTETGAGGDVGNSDGFYHWGALLAYLGFLED